MPHFSEQEVSPYSPRQLYDLVADIESYPEFLPWCRAARILSGNGNVLHAELVIAFKHIRQSYVSEVTMHPPEHDNAECAIEVDMLRGPFKHLNNHWKFIPRDGSDTVIMLDLDFSFSSRLLDKAIGAVFGHAAEKMALSFKQRADVLYGKSDKVNN